MNENLFNVRIIVLKFTT